MFFAFPIIRRLSLSFPFSFGVCAFRFSVSIAIHWNDPFSLIVYIERTFQLASPSQCENNRVHFHCNWILNYVNEKLSLIGLHLVCIAYKCVHRVCVCVCVFVRV